MNDFDKQTRDKAGDEPRALFLDGHSSHYSKKLLDAAKERNIHIFGYPPHCTHALQGLDVVCFGSMKAEFSHEINTFEAENGRGVDKPDFAGVFGRAFLRAFTEETVRAAFSKTGIVPFNPNVVSPTQMKPSEVTSLKGTFPLPQPPSISMLTAAVYSEPITAFDRDPSHAEAPPSVAHPHAASSPDHTDSPSSVLRSDTPPPLDLPSAQSPRSSLLRSIHDVMYTPRRKRTLSIGCEVQSPARKRRAMISTLASHPLGTNLISDSEYTSDIPIPAPIFEPVPSFTLEALGENRHTVHERMERLEAVVQTQNEGLQRLNTQLALQNLYLHALNRTLRGKENKKTSDRTKLFPEGNGRLLTHPSFVSAIEQIEQRKLDGEQKKERKAVAVAAARKAKEDVEREWREIKITHDAAVKLWEDECERLQRTGVLKKNLPKKPKCPLKPRSPKTNVGTVAVADGLESTEDENENETDSEVDEGGESEAE